MDLREIGILFNCLVFVVVGFILGLAWGEKK